MSELESRFTGFFSGFKDFVVDTELKGSKENQTVRVDVVLYYAEKPIACVEIKDNNRKEGLEKHLRAQLQTVQNSFDSVKFFFGLVGGAYYYYDDKRKELIGKSEYELFEMLLASIYDNATKCNDLLDEFNEKVQKGENGDTFKKHLKKDSLLRYGKNIFFDSKEEISLMLDLLQQQSSLKDYHNICRYTSAKSFFLSINKAFRVCSVEAMNDTLETKVIDKDEILGKVNTELSQYIYKGFIMCFTSIQRKDELFNWYMYGDRAKGVCFVAEPQKECSTDIFIAPVVYCSQTDKCELLHFLSKLLNEDIGGYKFVLRYWHLWKYFFKYDYYKDEEEVRVLFIKRKDASQGDSQKDDIKMDWHPDNIPYYYIDVKKEELPFKIKEIVLGPKLENKEEYKSYLQEHMKGVAINGSRIEGYR